MEQSRAITKKSASNLALAFILLPREKRDGMAALYAFCREVDDIADDESVPVEKRRTELARWREDVRKACSGQAPEIPVNVELQSIIQQYKLPFHYFDELIKGVEMDLDINRYANFDELEEYCYRVASVVGLLSIEIFGYKHPASREYAVYLGKALQLTNILRDVRTDAERGRIYLPQCELQRFHVSPDDILNFRYSENYRKLAEHVAARARYFYRLAFETLPKEDRHSMVAAELMGSVYWRLMEKLEKQRFNVFGPIPTRLSKPQKILLILRTWIRLNWGAPVPNYGV